MDDAAEVVAEEIAAGNRRGITKVEKYGLLRRTAHGSCDERLKIWIWVDYGQTLAMDLMEFVEVNSAILYNEAELGGMC